MAEYIGFGGFGAFPPPSPLPALNRNGYNMSKLKPGIYYGVAKKTPAMIKLDAEMNAKMGKMIKASDAAQEQACRDMMWLRLHRTVII